MSNARVVVMGFCLGLGGMLLATCGAVDDSPDVEVIQAAFTTGARCTSRAGCVGVANATASCSNRRCEYTCNSRFRACGTACIPATACCTNADCVTRANATATCSAGTGACSYTCNAGFNPCGAACIPATACCTNADCTSGPPNTVATCSVTANSCSYACASSLTCLNGAVVCSSWAFESRTVEGWSFGLGNLEPAPMAAVTNARAAAGSFSLFAPVSTIAWLLVPVCPGVGANMAGKSFHAQVYVDTGAVAFNNQSQDFNLVFVKVTTDPNIPPFGAQSVPYLAYFDPALGSKLFIPNGWNSVDFTIPSDAVTRQAAMIQIGIQLGDAPAIYTQGRLYVDDVRIF